MFINLHEIPNEGKTWTFNRKTGELNESLKDLLRSQEFTATLTITPLSPASGTFDLNGHIQTDLPEQCSRCGLDFQLQISEKFQNLLMPALATPRDAKFAKPNHFSDMHESGPDVTEYEGHAFNVGEFFHELVALAEPSIPVPPTDAQGKCGVCKISVKDHSFNYNSGELEPAHPFAALKGIKLN